MAQLSGMFIYPVVHLSGVHCTTTLLTTFSRQSLFGLVYLTTYIGSEPCPISSGNNCQGDSKTSQTTFKPSSKDIFWETPNHTT